MKQSLQISTQVVALVKNVDLKYSTQGKAVLNLNLETKRFDDKTTFVNAITFDKLAENIGDNVSDGDIISFDGSTFTSSFKGSNGKNVYQTKVLINGKSFKVLEKGEPKANKQDSFGTSSQIDISDDDLPF